MPKKLGARSAVKIGNRASTDFMRSKTGQFVKSYQISREDADVCLNCTERRCTGDENCFRRRKRKLAKEKEESEYDG